MADINIEHKQRSVWPWLLLLLLVLVIAAAAWWFLGNNDRQNSAAVAADSAATASGAAYDSATAPAYPAPADTFVPPGDTVPR